MIAIQSDKVNLPIFAERFDRSRSTRGVSLQFTNVPYRYAFVFTNRTQLRNVQLSHETVNPLRASENRSFSRHNGNIFIFIVDELSERNNLNKH